MSFAFVISNLRQLEEELSIQRSYEDFIHDMHDDRLQILYRQCILEYPTESHADNVDAMLWRHCFYQPIDYYRRQLKHPKGSSGRWALAELNRHIDAGYAFLACLIQSLVSLGGGFPIELLNEMLRSLGLSYLGERGCRPIPGLDATIYRLLIFCGDLARYRSQFNQSFQTDQYQLAWKLYQAALQLEPNHGHAANQMAVVVSMLHDPLTTVFWYLRAECCSMPFPAARHNLVSFLDRHAAHDEPADPNTVRPFLRFVQRAMSLPSFATSDGFAEWADSSRFTVEKYTLILTILLAAAHITEDLHGSFEDAIDRFLEHGIPETTECADEKTLILLLLSLIHSKQRLALARSGDKVLQSLCDLHDLKIGDAIDPQEIVGLQGFAFYDDLWEILAQFSSDQPLLSGFLSCHLRIEGLELRDGVAHISSLEAAPSPSNSASFRLFSPDQESADEGSQDEIVIFRGLGAHLK